MTLNPLHKKRLSGNSADMVNIWFIKGRLGVAMRMLGADYFVRLGNADPIHHMESLSRVLRRMDFYGRRNEI
jgi:hypothetical protein